MEKVVVVCDAHAETEEHEGAAYELSLRVFRDGRWVDLIKPGVVDICDEAEQDILAKAIELWEERRRPADGSKPRSAAGSFWCTHPGCGAGPYTAKGTLTGHQRSKHGYISGRAPEAAAEPKAAAPAKSNGRGMDYPVAVVRSWAQGQGMAVAARGPQVKKEVVEAWRAAGSPGAT